MDSGRIGHDGEIHKWRHLLENDFAKIKEFRGIATRYDKTAISFRANINLAATLIDCRSMSAGAGSEGAGHAEFSK